jgi:hypothetical protein
VTLESGTGLGKNGEGKDHRKLQLALSCSIWVYLFKNFRKSRAL